MNLREIGEKLDLPWSYVEIGELGDIDIKLVRYYGEYPEHSHDEDQFMLVVEGEVEVEMNSEIHHMKEMDFMEIPGNTMHRPIARKPSLVLVVWKRGIRTKIE